MLGEFSTDHQHRLMMPGFFPIPSPRGHFYAKRETSFGCEGGGSFRENVQ
jgi:hypothetical protein